MSRSTSRYVSPSLASTSVQVDPSTPGTTIRWALAIEAGTNVLASALMISRPSSLLRLISSSSFQPDPLAASMLQWLGGLTLALTAPLLLAAQNTKSGIESRPVVYSTLLSMEVALLPLLAWQAMMSDTFSPKALANVAGGLMGTFFWRIWVLRYRPEIMGKYTEEKKNS